jgi:hypothetical protein
MKIDEGSLPEGRSVRVRCPHCNEIGPAQEPVSLAEGLDTSSLPRDRILAAPKAARTGRGGDFHLPANQAPAALEKKMLSRGVKIVLWVIGSLLVVGFFALLVNIILPGPYGGGPGGDLPSQDDASARPAEKHRPAQWEKEASRSPAKR